MNNPNKLFANAIDPMEIAEKHINLNPLYYDHTKLWWKWEEESTKWVFIDETDILNNLRESFEIVGLTSPGFKSSLMESFRLEARRNEPEKIKPSWVQFGDMIYDVANNDEIMSTPYHFVTNPLSYKIGKTEETPVMDKLFNEWVGKEQSETLYQIIAYCCLPSYPINRIFAFVGSGSNGKGRFFELINRFIGLKNITSTELDVLISNRFESSKLYKKLVCMMSETNANTIKQTSILKKLSGGDLIGYEMKNKNPFEDYNYAKILISTNTLPQTGDNTDGFYRRWQIIKFNNKFGEGEDPLNRIPDVEYNNLALKCLNILKDLWVTRKFKHEGSIEDRREAYESESDPFGKFWDQFIVTDVEGDISKSKFAKELNSYLKKNGYRNMNDMEIARRMKEQGIDSIRTSFNTDEGKTIRYRTWVNIDWNSSGKNNHLSTLSTLSTLSQLIPSYSKSELNTLDTLDTLDMPKTFKQKEEFISIALINQFTISEEMGKKTLSIEELEVLTNSQYTDFHTELDLLLTNGNIFEVKPGVFKLLN